ncbi:hypothetical protein WN943_010673 [Citrus x changshan-huyou]
MGSLLELDIEHKLSSITIDNAATNDHIIDFMLLALAKNEPILGGQKFHGDDAISRVQMMHGDCQSIVKEYKARYASAARSPRYSYISSNGSHSMPSSGSHGSSTEWISWFTSCFNAGNEKWKMNGSNYPILSPIAGDILTILVTTVAFKSAFSANGQFVSSYHNRLLPSTLTALICSQSWIRALCGVVASTSPAYAKILDKELEIETDAKAVEDALEEKAKRGEFKANAIPDIPAHLIGRPATLDICRGNVITLKVSLMKFVSSRDGNGTHKPTNSPKPVCQNPFVAGNFVGCEQELCWMGASSGE